MAIRLGNNITALGLSRRLESHTSQLNRAFERLSTGLRVTRASDDAANLAVSEAIRADVRISQQGLRNINDGISAASIAEGALTQLHSIVTRQYELAEQAANGTQTLAQRRALHAEANALVDEFNRIVNTTEFNGTRLLDGSSANLDIQVGQGTTARIGINLSNLFTRASGTGTFGTGVTVDNFSTGHDVQLADLNGDGFLDMALSDRGGGAADGIRIVLGNGDGTFRAATCYGGDQRTLGLELGDVNGDGILDAVVACRYENEVGVYLGNGDGTFKARRDSSTFYSGPNELSLGDINGDGKLDIAAGRYGSDVIILLGDGTGSFSAVRSVLIPLAPSTNLTDVNNDGRADLISSASGSDLMLVMISNGDGTFYNKQTPLATGDAPSDVELVDLNFDGYKDIVTANFQTSDSVSIFLANSDGSFQNGTQYTVGQSARKLDVADIDGDGYTDIVVGNDEGTVTTLLGNGNGTLKAPQQSSTIASGVNFIVPELGDLNGDGVPDLVLAAEAGTVAASVYLSNTTRSSTEGYLYLLSRDGALNALTTLRTTLNRISLAQGGLGAFQSRLSAGTNQLSVMAENLAAANARISDIDVAEEAANMVRLKILQQSTTALLAQSNREGEIALRLLRD